MNGVKGFVVVQSAVVAGAVTRHDALRTLARNSLEKDGKYEALAAHAQNGHGTKYSRSGFGKP